LVIKPNDVSIISFEEVKTGKECKKNVKRSKKKQILKEEKV